MYKTILLAVSFFFLNTSFANFSYNEGRLFVVQSNFEATRQWITFCLLKANNKVDCEQFIITGTELYIRTVNPTDSPYFLNASIKGHQKNTYTGCQLMSNEYCAFPVSHNKISYIKLGWLP